MRSFSNESNWRRLVFDLLALLSSSKKQLEYENNVPAANVPAELVCMWFDDSYYPNNIGFQNSFTQHELELLAEFNMTLQKAKDKLPASSSISKWQKVPAWHEVMVAASRALEGLKEEESIDK